MRQAEEAVAAAHEIALENEHLRERLAEARDLARELVAICHAHFLLSFCSPLGNR